MFRCDICLEVATYRCADPGVNPVHYCARCLPVWLQEQANAGQFPLLEVAKEETVSIEEPSVEDTDTETSAPKTTKKKKADSSNADSN